MMDSATNRWLFDGVGGAALVGLTLFLLERIREGGKADKNTYSKNSRDNNTSVRNETSGDRNLSAGRDINYHAPPAHSPAVAPVPPVRSLPKLRKIDEKLIHVRLSANHGRIEEAADGKTEVMVVAFKNDPTVGGDVKASLVYGDQGTDVLDIVGGWIDSELNCMHFEVEDVRKVIIGLKDRADFVAIEKYRQPDGYVRTNFHPVICDTVKIRLTHADLGDVLYEGRFKVTLAPLGIAPA